ncbi:hypothetical protein TL18_00610 [Methanobrevibacter sp. YE315]|uniref:ABC transporter permease n=1 Tax=Methanobrevibacter sp. YE315 TaxID=1609968 RepID=UPI000764D2FB|nr:ABC transporter permease [Methanobrevibacter sp. YE315]AMD16667.1 hypothetical protein TL18_00610 [Methanobrevibacter sp. YE315]
MKDSKEKEHRISNLKDMIDNVKDENVYQFDEMEEDEELIEYLNKDAADFDDFEIDDEFIYRPGDETDPDVNLEENPIDENYIIKTPKESSIEDGNDSFENEEIDDIVSDVSNNFDALLNAKIGRTSILGILSTLLGLILVVVSAIIFQSRSDRVIDNVVSGETNFISIIILAIGVLLLIYGLYKVLHIRNPLSNITSTIDSIDLDENKSASKDNVSKSQPDDDTYKIGEFGIDELKAKFRKNKKTKNQPITEEDFDKIPPAREKEESKKGLTAEEIEDIEYKQAKLDHESIDEIFAEVEAIEDVPLDFEDK